MAAGATFDPGDVHPDIAPHSAVVRELGKLREGLEVVRRIKKGQLRLPSREHDDDFGVFAEDYLPENIGDAITALDGVMRTYFDEIDAHPSKAEFRAKAEAARHVAPADEDEADATGGGEEDGGEEDEK
jgi:hypothetical protein